MKALVGAFNQEKALVGAFSVIVQPVMEPMDRFTALFRMEWNFNERQLGCTGSLLDSSHVLIAAHCLKWCCGKTKACPTCKEDQTGEMTVRECP